MLTIARHLSKCLYTPRIYLMADTDRLSRSKVEELESGRLDYIIETVQRVREVGQSWVSTAFGVPRAIFQSIKILSFYNPTLVAQHIFIYVLHNTLIKLFLLDYVQWSWNLCPCVSDCQVFSGRCFRLNI
jgi:hypothetical protein